MVNKSVVNTVRKYLRTLDGQGIPVHFGVVYGSQARGTTHEWSDIDLLVVSPMFDKQRKREDWVNIWLIANRTDSRIEPIPVGERQYQEDDSSAIIEIARREGQIIPLAE